MIKRTKVKWRTYGGDKDSSSKEVGPHKDLTSAVQEVLTHVLVEMDLKSEGITYKLKRIDWNQNKDKESINVVLLRQYEDDAEAKIISPAIEVKNKLVASLSKLQDECKEYAKGRKNVDGVTLFANEEKAKEQSQETADAEIPTQQMAAV